MSDDPAPEARRIVVIGGGQGAASIVTRLRALGHAGPLNLVTAEPLLPYQRPPISKKYLSGEMTVDRLLVRPDSWYEQNAVTVHRGVAATAIDRHDRVVHLADGTVLPYDRLGLATGSVPRRLPAAIGGDLPGVYTLRDVADADRLAPELVAGRRLLVVGGGYIGLEAAAVARGRGLEVTVLELADRILQRVAAPETSAYFADLHGRHGVTLRTATGLSRLEACADGRVARAVLSDGAVLAVDVVVVGIGIVPDDRLARAADLACEDGIVVDARCRTSDPAIFACGDCARLPFRGRLLRLESVQNAVDQGAAAALAMLDRDGLYEPKPWFWSDQYDVKLQIAGLGQGHDHIVVRPGARDGSQSVWYYAAETLLAVDAMNEPLVYAMAKKILDTGKSVPPDAAANPATVLKDYA